MGPSLWDSTGATSYLGSNCGPSVLVFGDNVGVDTRGGSGGLTCLRWVDGFGGRGRALPLNTGFLFGNAGGGSGGGSLLLLRVGEDVLRLDICPLLELSESDPGVVLGGLGGSLGGRKGWLEVEIFCGECIPFPFVGVV